MKIGLGIGIPKNQTISGEGFSFSDVSGLFLDLDANQDVLTSGSDVTQVIDQVNSIVFNSGSAAAPEYLTNAVNGLPAIRFNGTNEGLISTTQTTSGATGFSVFLVMNLRGTGTSQKNILRWRPNGLFGDGNSGLILELIINLIGNNTGVEDDSGNSIGAAPGSTAMTAGWQILSIIYGNNNIKIYRNGALIDTLSTIGSGSLPLGTVTPNNPIWIARNYDSANRHADIDLARNLIYAQAVNDADRDSIEGSLSTIYNITLA